MIFNYLVYLSDLVMIFIILFKVIGVWYDIIVVG